MSKPIITVIVPVFNEENYIDRCLKSLESQTYHRLQIILVDGGSTDGSAAICDRWASKWNMGPDSNMGIVEVIHTSNRGVSASRNMGLDHASGELITFLDGDDWLEPDMLSVLYELMESEHADMAGCDFESRYPGDPVQHPSGSAQTEVTDKAGFLDGHILHGDTHVWGRLFKRELIGRMRFGTDLTIGEDMVFVIEYVRNCDRIAHTSYRGYNYYRNPSGAMMRPFTASSMDQVSCWERAGQLLSEEYPDIAKGDDLRANMLISVMLTASKMALLDRDTLREEANREHIKVLRGKIREYRSRGAMKKLDRGYRLKVRLFRFLPGLYMRLYHMHKSR